MDNKKIIAHLTVSVIGGVAGSLLVEALKEHTEKRANERLQEIMAYAKLSTLRADTEAKMEALEEKEKMYREHIRNMTKNRSREHSKMERDKKAESEDAVKKALQSVQTKPLPTKKVFQNWRNPFDNLTPAEIPTECRDYRYQKKKEDNKDV